MSEPMTKKTTAYKAFDKNFKCRDFQYEVGKTYHHDGEIEICSSGFHACENPLDTLNYYPLIGSRFAEVVFEGDIQAKSGGNDSKICGGSITISAEITVGDFIKRAVDWIVEKATSGDDSPAATSGYSSPAATSGYSSPAATSGKYSPAATSGYSSPAATSGDDSPAATSGYSSPAATSGKYSPAATSGYSSPAATSGYSSPAATSGYSSPAEANGTNSVAASVGYGGKAKAAEGGGISLAEYDRYGNLINIRSAMVGTDGVKPDTWYQLKDGEFVEVVL